MSMRLSIRAAKTNITPSGEESLAGYARRKCRAHSIHRPLEANAILIEPLASLHEPSVAVVSVDALAVSKELRSAIAEELSCLDLCEEKNVVVVATHTHSAPSSWVGTIHPGLPAELEPRECRRVARLIGQALRCSDPHSFEIALEGQSEVDGVGLNRNSPDGPVDKSLWALEATDTSGNPTCILFNYACHATVLGPDNCAYSPDWVGSARERCRAARKAPNLPVLFLPGSGGDVSTRFNRQATTWDEADRIGNIVGDAILSALTNGRPKRPSMAFERHTFQERTRTDFGDIESPQLDDAPTDRLSASFEEGLLAARALAADPTWRQMTIPVELLDLAGEKLVFVPFELGAELADRVLRQTPRTRLVGYAEAYCGYLVTGKQAAEGQYEALSSLFSLSTTDQIVETIAGLL